LTAAACLLLGALTERNSKVAATAVECHGVRDILDCLRDHPPKWRALAAAATARAAAAAAAVSAFLA
jgi:hypothetical protein